MSSVQDDAVRRAMALWAGDAASRTFGFRLVEVRSGFARVALDTVAAMANGHGTVHGGIVFALADSAFAMACNTSGPAVAHHCDIVFLRPNRPGDVLEATARERASAGRSGVYDVSVTNQAGAVVAEFRGHSRSIDAPGPR